MSRLKKIKKFIAAALLSGFLVTSYSHQNDLDSLLVMNIEELLDLSVVSATKTKKKISEAPGTIVSVNSKEIEETGARTLSDLLKRVSGIQILNRRNGRDMVWIRGVTTGYNTKVLLLIDGIPQREAIFGEWSPDEEIPINNIDHIEIIRGPGSALYGGNAYAGIISVFTKSQAGHTTASVKMGSFSTKQLEFYSGHGYGNSKIIISGRAMESDGHQMDVDRKGNPSNHRDYVNAKNLQGKFIHKNLKVGITHNDFVTDYPLYKSGKDKPQTFKTTRGSAEYLFRKQKLAINPKLFFHYGERIYHGTTKNKAGALVSAHEQNSRSIVTGFDAQLTHQLSGYNTLVAGAFFEHKNAMEFYEENTLVTAIDGFITPTGDTAEHRVIKENFYYSWLNKNADNNSGPGRVKTSNYAVYLQDEWRFLNDKLNLILGVRADKYENIDMEFSPRAAVVIRPLHYLFIKALGGTAFKPPTFRQTHMVRKDGKSPGNPKVGPERITTFESEISYRISQSLLLKFNYFNNYLNDFIESVDYKPYSNKSYEINISGLETALRIEYPVKRKLLSRLSFFLNYTYTDARLDSNGFKSDVSNVAKHSANLGLILRNQWISLFNGFNYLGERNNSLSWRTTDYLIWDFNLRSENIAGLPVRLELSVHNLMDKKHYNPTYDPGNYFPYTKEGRNIGVKIIADF